MANSRHGRASGRPPRRRRTAPPHAQIAKQTRKLGRRAARDQLDAAAATQAPLFETTLGGERPWSADRYVLIDGQREVAGGPFDTVAEVAALWQPSRTFMRAVDADGGWRQLNEDERDEAVRVKDKRAA